MRLEEFQKQVEKEVGKNLGSDYQTNGQKLLQNNGEASHAVAISRPGYMTSCVHIDGFYHDYLEGVADVADIAEEIVRLYRANAQAGMDLSKFADYGNVTPRLRGQLVNTKRNRELLARVPHREFLDLSLVYAIELSEPGEPMGRLRIHNGHLAGWGVKERDLYKAARENMESFNEAFLESMGAFLAPWLDPDKREALDASLYILSNKRRFHGAVQMLNRDALRRASEILKGGFFILPSSLHECILVPEDGDGEFAQELAEIVREVNDTQVAKEEILSYHVYRYDRKNENIAIAA